MQYFFTFITILIISSLAATKRFFLCLDKEPNTNKQNIMKRIVLISATMLIAVASLILFSTKEKSDYSTWLAAQYSKIPEMDYDEAKAIPKMDRPDLAAMQNYLEIVDPVEKRVPVERLLPAYKATKAIEAQASAKNPTPLEWEIQPSIMGGRTRALMWDPNSNSGNRVWAGSVTGGLWYNNNITDNTEQWQSVDEFWANLSISCITYDPNNTMDFYVGTGESQTALQTYRSSSGVGFGILKSSDGGETWNWIESTQEWAYVNDIMIRDEEGTSVIYAAVASGKYYGNHTSEPSDGLYRSDDGGQSWEQVLPNITDMDVPYTPADIVMTADGRLIIGTAQNIDGEGGATILYSDEGTAGTWTVNETYKLLIEQGTGGYSMPGRIMLAEAPSDANRVYGVVAGGYMNTYPYYHCRYIIKSDDKGETWTNVTNPDGGQWSSLAWHAFVIEVDPNNADKLFIGGLDQWTSADGGNYWYHVSDWALMYYGGGDEYVHADQHVVAYKPGSSTEAVFGTDGGVFYTNDADDNTPVFQQRNNNYNTLQFYSCAIKPTEGSQELLGGLQDNGSLWHDGTPVGINDMVQGGDGAFCFFDEDQPQYAYTSVYYNRYQAYINGQYTNYLGDETGTFINAGDLDWKDNIMFNNSVGYNGSNANKIQRYSNVPNIGSSSRFTVPTGNIAYFSAITYSRHSEVGEPTIYAGTNAGKLFRIEDADESSPESFNITGEEWPAGSISSIAVGGSDDTLMVTFSNYGVISVWQTYNAGESWDNVEGNLPDMPVRWAIYHPQNSLQVLLATETGVWTTVNGGAADVEWFPVSEGLGNVRVDMLRVRYADNKVVAASHGRGLHVADWPLDISVGISRQETSELNIYPNPATDFVNIEVPANVSGTIVIRDISGKIIHKENSVKGVNTINVEGFNSGVYTISIIENERAIREAKLMISK